MDENGEKAFQLLGSYLRWLTKFRLTGERKTLLVLSASMKVESQCDTAECRKSSRDSEKEGKKRKVKHGKSFPGFTSSEHLSTGL